MTYQDYLKIRDDIRAKLIKGCANQLSKMKAGEIRKISWFSAPNSKALTRVSETR